jgi:hypothetical protein
LNLVDVHEGGQLLFVVDDAGAWWFYSLATTGWASGNFPAVDGPYSIEQLYVDSFGNARVAGVGTGRGAGFVGYYHAQSQSWFEDFDEGVGGSKEPFVSVGPSYTADSSNPTVFLGRNATSNVRRHAEKMPYFSDADIPLPSSEPVTGITGNIGASLTPSLYFITFSGLFRSTLVVGVSNVETLLDFTLRGSTKVAMSKNDVGGVLVAEVAPFGNNVFRRGPTVNEALDLAVDYQTITTYGSGLPLPLLVTQDNDVAYGLANKATYGVAKGPFFRVADAAGTVTGAIIVGAAGTVQRFTVSTGAFTNVSGAAAQLNAICRASDSDMFIVGNGGAIYRYTGGNTLTTLASGTNQDLRAVDCSGGEVLACGNNGTVLRFTSGMWRSIGTGLTGNFESCRFGPNGALYAAGNGTFSKFENNAWTSLNGDSGTQKLIVVGPTEVYAIANGGKEVKRFDGQNWNVLLTTQTVLRGGSQVGAKVVFVGDSGWVVEGQ